MTKRHTESAILEGPITQASVAEASDEASGAAQEGQQPEQVAATELSPTAMAAAAQSTLERTQRRLAELSKASKEREQPRMEIAQHLSDIRAAARQAEQQIPLALETVGAAKALRATLHDTPAGERSAAGVTHAEQTLAQAKHAATVTAAACESGQVEALEQLAELEKDEALDLAERDELEQLLPHLEAQMQEVHRQMGRELLEQFRAQILEQEEAVRVAQKAVAEQEQALAELKHNAGQALVAYSELNLERQRSRSGCCHPAAQRRYSPVPLSPGASPRPRRESVRPHAGWRQGLEAERDSYAEADKASEPLTASGAAAMVALSSCYCTTRRSGAP